MIRFIQYILIVLLISPPVAQAQSGYFGQNKVQYKDFQWEMLKTPHFEVYYYEEERETALDAARMAERSYARLSRILQHRFIDPIPLILYASHADFQQTNVIPQLIEEGTGGVTEFSKGRVFLPFTGSYAELEHVLTHELTHAFQIDILFGSRAASSLDRLSFQPPLWFMEGMAEYLSIGGVEAHTDMWLRDAALQGYLTSIPELNYTYDIRAYRFGQAIWAYIGARDGDQKIGEILHKTAFLRSVDHAFSSAIGMDLQALSDAWTEEVRRTYLPQVARFVKPDRVGLPLTDRRKTGAGFYLAPAVSPSGKWVVYISNESLYNDLYLASATDGRTIKKLIAGERSGGFESLRFFSTSIAWSPDEKHIAFPAKVGAKDALYIMNVLTKEIVRRMTFDLDGLSSPYWSPDGRRLVFVGLKGGQSDLYTVDADGRHLRALTNDRYTDRDPVWSPDGRMIAFSTDRGAGTDFSALTFAPQQLALYDLQTGEIAVFPNQSGKNISPQWSNDGRYLAFISDRTGISNIYMLDLSTCQAYQITDILTGVTNITAAGPAISWASKGNRLVFSAFTSGGWELYAITEPTRLISELYASLPASVSTAPTRTAVRPVPKPASSMVASLQSDWTDDLPHVFSVAVRPERADTASETGKYNQSEASYTVALPDTGTFKRKPYTPRFSLDFSGGSAGYASGLGFTGQSIFSFSDILGNHNLLIGANAYGSLTEADLFVQYTNLAHRTNYGAALFQYRADLFYQFLSTTVIQAQTQVNRGFAVFFSRPFNRFRRFEFTLQGVNRTRYLVDITSDPFWGVRRDKQMTLGSTSFLTPGIAFVSDNALFGSMGPIAGTRTRLAFSPTIGGLDFFRFLVDYRTYLNIRQRYALAVRLFGLISEGRDQELVPFGGPYDFRGLDFWSVWGSKVGLMNLEFRFPLIEILQLGWPLPLGFRRIRGALFLDVGGAWDPSTSPTQAGQYSGYPNAGILRNDRLEGTSTMEEVSGGPVAAAYGFGARSRFGFLIFKFDVARQIDLGMRPSWYNREHIPGIPVGMEDDFAGTRSYRLRKALNHTRLFFTIGTEF